MGVSGEYHKVNSTFESSTSPKAIPSNNSSYIYREENGRGRVPGDFDEEDELNQHYY